MSKIRIKNFGPIKEGYTDDDGWMEIRKVTMFIGNQGSGKSTVAKLISTFTWMEKALLNGNLGESEADTHDFVTERCSYFRLKKYFRADTELYYEGDYVNMTYAEQLFEFHVKEHRDLYDIPKIMYVPAERSFLSSVEDADSVGGLPKPLFTFMDENNRSLKALDDVLPLPFGNYRLRYDHLRRISYILGSDYELELNAASSGLHSAVPLFVVSRDLAQVVATGKTDSSISALNYKQQMKKNAELLSIQLPTIDEVIKPTDESLKREIGKEKSIIESKYRSSSFLNIVEEPEQNLFPTSQKDILYSLFEFNNMMRGNKLIITTHSPYLINYLTLAVKAYEINGELKSDLLKERLDAIVPSVSVVNPDNLVIYELNEKDGTVIRLPDYYGIPSDKNYLNQSLGDSNLLYDALLEIQEDNES